jgi:hypothetical protein
MFTAPDQITDAARLIQVALTPVFLLLSIGVILGVLTNRLARVIDRARKLEDAAAAGSQDASEVVRVLGHRASLIYRSITFATIAAIAVAFVVVLLFADTFLGIGLSPVIATVFVLAILSLAVGLVIFLVEVRVATSALRIGR